MVKTPQHKVTKSIPFARHFFYTEDIYRDYSVLDDLSSEYFLTLGASLTATCQKAFFKQPSVQNWVIKNELIINILYSKVL